VETYRTTRQAKPLLLWFDFSSSPQDREPRVHFARRFRISYCTRPDRAMEDAAGCEPRALCFEFDRIDAPRLQSMSNVIQAHLWLPALMLTVDHSESLAIWAFRTGAWNVLVKPVATEDLRDNVEGLAQIVSHGSPRQCRPPLGPMPEDVAVTPSDDLVTHLEPALQYVRRHYTDKITEAEAARRCGRSRFVFSRNFHAAFGLPFREHVMRTRIGEARRMLAEGDHGITEVAFATGFSDGSYFARMFRRYTGVLPSEYRAPDGA
jgi:AraC-like DNA-binding protein